MFKSVSFIFFRKLFSLNQKWKTFTGIELYVEHFFMLICAILILYALDLILNSNKFMKRLIGK